MAAVVPVPAVAMVAGARPSASARPCGARRGVAHECLLQGGHLLLQIPDVLQHGRDLQERAATTRNGATTTTQVHSGGPRAKIRQRVKRPTCCATSWVVVAGGGHMPPPPPPHTQQINKP